MIKYRTRYFRLKLICTEPDTNRSAAVSYSPVPNTGKRKFKFSTIELKKFCGHFKQWLPFWSQFKKLPEDPEIDLDDTIGYLN